MAFAIRKRFVAWGVLGLLTILAVLAAGWIVSLPSPPLRAMPAPVADEVTAQMLAALKPTKRQRPVVASIGINDGTETTDYLVPYGIFKRADVADVVMVATQEGPVDLYPALKVQPETTVADFDARYPEGADYVIVPAMSRNDDPTVMRWLKEQAGKGAMIIGVCAGALVVAEAGLLDGKQATTHWYFLKQLRSRHPDIQYVADRRMVIDGKVATTTGISASLPMSLTLIEAIGGRAKAAAVAAELGVDNWDIRHDSGAFIFTRPFALTVLGNTLSPWTHETLGLALTPGVDEVSLALVADAWSRTYRSRAITSSTDGAPVTTRNGLRIVPDEARAAEPEERTVPDRWSLPPTQALEQTLDDIAQRYGTETAEVVAMQLEYPRLPAR